MEWTTKSIAVLKKGYRTGQAAAVIANLLGTTKGSVVGKAHRMNLKHPGAILPTKPPKIKKYVKEVYSTIGKCQYPHGNPKDAGFYFCHDQVEINSSYCAKHHAICYRTKKEESDAAKKRAIFYTKRSKRG